MKDWVSSCEYCSLLKYGGDVITQSIDLSGSFFIKSLQDVVDKEVDLLRRNTMMWPVLIKFGFHFVIFNVV